VSRVTCGSDLLHSRAVLFEAAELPRSRNDGVAVVSRCNSSASRRNVDRTAVKRSRIGDR